MNREAAIEWLRLASHNLRGAEILYEAGHYTDTIGCELQQAIEKVLKAIPAYRNEKILRTHDLYRLFTELDIVELTEEEEDLLALATQYLKEERYPNPNYELPPREEIAQVLRFAEKLYGKICDEIGIDPNEIEG